MSDKEEVKDLKLSEDVEYKYVDIELGYQFEFNEPEEIDSIISAINSFVATHKKGLTRTNINILGYSYKY